jgi:hypothetical protein
MSGLAFDESHLYKVLWLAVMIITCPELFLVVVDVLVRASEFELSLED